MYAEYRKIAKIIWQASDAKQSCKGRLYCVCHEVACESLVLLDFYATTIFCTALCQAQDSIFFFENFNIFVGPSNPV